MTHPTALANSDAAKVALIILDGVGINPSAVGNAVELAEAPFYKHLFTSYPNSSLITYGERVGLPHGQMGNSEVGHLTIGSGRIVRQSLTRISYDLEQSDFATTSQLGSFINSLPAPSNIHLIGLLSDGGVHSHQEHLEKLILHITKFLQVRVVLHLITDGRDTSPHGGVQYLAKLEKFIDDCNRERSAAHADYLPIVIGSISGRYYAMDRDKRWERTEQTYKVLFGETTPVAKPPLQYLGEQYQVGITDEFVVPVSFGEQYQIRHNDGLVFWNFRADRMRQLTESIFATNFEHFARQSVVPLSKGLSFTEYDAELKLPCLFPTIAIKNHLGEWLASHGVRQLRAAETEKYPHVTYFFNGGEEEVFPGEDRVLVPSPRDVATYDLKPEMSAAALTDKVVAAVSECGDYRFIALNYANGDMVGHTGVIPAVIKAIETVDTCLARIIPFLVDRGWCCLVIADHGNAEQLIDYATGRPHTAHTTHPVPIILINGPVGGTVLSGGTLEDIAPTVIALLNMPQPTEMTGRSLVQRSVER